MLGIGVHPLTVSVRSVAGPRQARGEDGQQVGVPRVQPRVPPAQGHQPRVHQVLPEQRRRPHRGGAPAPGRARPRREDDPHRPLSGAESQADSNSPPQPPCNPLEQLAPPAPSLGGWANPLAAPRGSTWCTPCTPCRRPSRGTIV